MRKWCFLLAALLFETTTAHSAETVVNAVQLHGPSGFSLAILLDERPRLTFSSDYLDVTTHLTSVSIPASQVTGYKYVHIDDASGIGPVSQSGAAVSFDGSQFRAAGLAPFSAVQIYTTDGALVSAAAADSRGSVTLALPEKAGAVYLVKTSGVTLKITKP